jgi:hypothetical protein
MKYIILTYESQPDFEARETATDRESLYWAPWQAYIDSMCEAGIVESMHCLRADYTATTLRLRGGRRQLQDGPCVDSGEQLGGYVVIDVSDLDAALDWAERCPAATTGVVEVRPLMQECVSHCIP